MKRIQAAYDGLMHVHQQIKKAGRAFTCSQITIREDTVSDVDAWL
jgi:hypothetical protein